MLTARLVQVIISSDSCACGRFSWSSSSRLASWYSASHLPSQSIRSDMIRPLQVSGSGFLGFYVLDLSVLFFFFFLPWSSSSPSVVSFCSFSFSRGLVLGLALVLFYDDNRMGGCQASSSSSSSPFTSCSSSCCCSSRLDLHLQARFSCFEHFPSVSVQMARASWHLSPGDRAHRVSWWRSSKSGWCLAWASGLGAGDGIPAPASRMSAAGCPARMLLRAGVSPELQLVSVRRLGGRARLLCAC